MDIATKVRQGWYLAMISDGWNKVKHQPFGNGYCWWVLVSSNKMVNHVGRTLEPFHVCHPWLGMINVPPIKAEMTAWWFRMALLLRFCVKDIFSEHFGGVGNSDIGDNHPNPMEPPSVHSKTAGIDGWSSLPNMIWNTRSLGCVSCWSSGFTGAGAYLFKSAASVTSSTSGASEQDVMNHHVSNIPPSLQSIHTYIATCGNPPKITNTSQQKNDSLTVQQIHH